MATYPCEENVECKPCKICGRTFNPTSLARHENICAKTKRGGIQRKKFDSFLQRAKDTSISPAKPEKKVEPRCPTKKLKEQQEEGLKATKYGKDTPHTSSHCRRCPTQNVIPLGYIQCPVCRRCFNHKAADRHISWCQEQISRVPKSMPSSEALQRLKARVQYRAPLPGKKRNAHPDAQRLVKSAESCKSPSIQRTYSSPGFLNVRSSTKHVAFQDNCQILPRGKSCERVSVGSEFNELRHKCQTLPYMNSRKMSSANSQATSSNQKAADYILRGALLNCADKEKCLETLYYEDALHFGKRSDSFDILSALRLQLAELNVKDSEIYDNCRNQNEHLGLPVVPVSQQSPSKTVCDSSDFDYYHNTSNNNVGTAGSSLKERSLGPKMPRFCYQCGTKYPIAAAKYCCECGAKRLILGTDENRL